MAEKTINSKFYKPNSQPVFGETYLKLTYDPSNGNTRLCQYNVLSGVVGVCDKIYENGVWNYDPGVITTVAEKNKVQGLVISSISKLKSDPRNVIPPFVTQNAPSKDQGMSGDPYLSQNSGGIGGQIREGLNRDPSSDFITTDQEKSLFKELLKYPRDILQSQQDTFQISQYRYKAPAKDVFTGSGAGYNIFTQGLQRNSAITDFIGKIILPMPNEVSDSNGVSWGDNNTISNFNLGMASYMYNNAEKNILGNLGIDAVNAAAQIFLAGETGGASVLGGAGGVLNDLAKGAKEMFAKLDAGAYDLNRPDLKALLTSALLKQLDISVSAETILQRGFGVVPNSNLELLFNGPALRQFTFSYRMSPRSELEAKNVKRIIRFFKQGMAARKRKAQAGENSLYLGTPNIFKLRYVTVGDKDISGVNKFKLCALTNCAVHYAPDGQWSAYDEGQPTSLIMGLSFNEIEPIYNTDYQEAGILTGLNVDADNSPNKPPVYPDDVGF